jgi:hypothetical protein
MAFTEAERTKLYLRCALFGPSGSGKTMTALRMAKGIAEKMGGRFAVIDTEARSASKYAGRFHFVVDNLEKKTVDDYIASMNQCIEKGYKVLVIDSLSHAWRELTDEVDRIAQKSVSKNTFSPWARVNPKQKRFIDAILNFPGHIIATMRSNTEWVIGDGKNGKSVPEWVGLKPEQGKGIEYEFDLLVQLDKDHQGTVTKDRTDKFQDEIIDKPGEDFGVALYDWLSEGKEMPPAVEPVPQAGEGTTGDVPPKQPAAKDELKARGRQIVQEIGEIITAATSKGNSYFTEEEKDGAREIIKTTKLNKDGVQDLQDFKTFIVDELTKRKAKEKTQAA